ncbi:MAG: type II secretion system F family protein [Erysipelotrichaceae bacterium]|nr:type II secretion system F family protein [Erysipelotrichaceae bacterium]
MNIKLKSLFSQHVSSLTEVQWLLLAKMIERHYSIKDAFETLAKGNEDNKAVKRICSGLNEGVPLGQLLSETPFERELSFYINFLSLDKSILIVNRQLKKEENILKRFASKISYQLVLLVASFALMFLFTDYVMPTMLRSLSLDTGRSSSIQFVFSILLICRNVLTVLIVMVVLTGGWVILRKRENYVWMFLHQYKMDKLIKTYATYKFVQKLNCLLENGISIIDAINVIRQQKRDRIVSLLAHHFNEVLLSGVGFEESLDMSYFDDDFHSLCLLGLKSDDFNQSLRDYEEMIDFKFEQYLKKVSVVIQAICYIFVATVIVMGYQVLLLPLEMLEGF